MSLTLLSLIIGTLLFTSHLFALKAAGICITEVKKFPRSRFWGTSLLAITTIWMLLMLASTDLGEFSPMRHLIMFAVLAGSALLWKFVPDFLSSRSLGFLFLLAAHPVLETTFLQHGFLHLALAALAYIWAITGLFLVGMPYLHRDLITWLCARKERWNLACWAGIIFGAVLLVEGTRLTLIG